MSKIIQTELLAEVVYEHIKKDILNKVYPGGEKLTVRKLCETYGVSETPVKQSLIRLVTEGLVENTPRKGMHVRHFYYESFKEIMTARNMIEQYAVDAAIFKLKQDPSFREEFTKIFHDSIVCSEQYMMTREELDYKQNYNLDLAFHKEIVCATQNQYIINIYNELITHQKMYYMCNSGVKSRISTVIKDHRDIFDGLINGNHASVQQVLHKHLCEYLEDDRKLFTE